MKEFEEKFRKAMIANAQLDNEKSSYAYQVDLLKDKLEELEETTAQLRRELREKNRDVEQLKRVSQRLKEDLDICKAQLLERDTLIQVRTKSMTQNTLSCNIVYKKVSCNVIFVTYNPKINCNLGKRFSHC